MRRLSERSELSRSWVRRRFPWSRLTHQPHHPHRAADREDRDRLVAPDLAGRALGRASDRDEGADLEAALSAVAVGLGVGVGNERLAPVGGPALQEIAVPGLVDLSGV